MEILNKDQKATFEIYLFVLFMIVAGVFIAGIYYANKSTSVYTDKNGNKLEVMEGKSYIKY